jgi:predicted outer membrane repeat protein
MYNILDYSSILNPMVLSNCTFSANTATDNGGGNIAGGDGGGMYNIQSSFVILNDCTFSGNTATYKGGGISNSWYSELEISNCTFSDNTADFGGGISNCYNSLSTVNNSTFSANTATDNGGGIYNDAFEFYQSDLTVTDSYFCTNAPDQIHGLYTDDGMKNYMYCPDGPEYQGDFDGDGDVDMIDFAAFAANWLAGV